MTTALDIVTGAMRLIGALAAGEAAEASEALDGLASLNQMLHALVHEGVDLGHGDLALASIVKLPDTHIETIRHMLALRLAPEYNLTLSPLVIRTAETGKAALQAIYADPEPMSIDGGLLRMPSQSCSRR